MNADQADMSVHAIGLGRNEQGLDGRRKNQLALLDRYGLQPTSRLLEIGCGIGCGRTTFGDAVGLPDADPLGAATPALGDACC